MLAPRCVNSIGPGSKHTGEYTTVATCTCCMTHWGWMLACSVQVSRQEWPPSICVLLSLTAQVGERLMCRGRLE